MESNQIPANEWHNEQKKLTPHELFKKHLSDPTHKLTDEELQSLETNPEVDTQFEKREKDKMEELTNEIGKHPLNPYDIVDND